MWEWLLASIDPTRAHDIGPVVSWHARVMVMAWGVLVPIGVLLARFWKITPGQNWPVERDNQFWWVGHRLAQYSALGLTLIGVALILSLQSAPASTTPNLWLHHWLGWTIVGFGVSQVVSGWLRGTKGGPTDPDGPRGDHYDMTPRRRAFERFHKTLGYTLMALAIAAIFSGLWQANAPRWMWILIPGWWACLIAMAAILQARGRAVDTYQAIWGPDRKHPGNGDPPAPH